MGAATGYPTWPSSQWPCQSDPLNSATAISGASGLGVVYLPGPSGWFCLTGPEEVACYARAFEEVRVMARMERESAAMLREMVAGRLAAR
jgi:hypothetical protein